MSTFNPQHYWEERLWKNFGPAGVGYIGMGRGYNYWLYEVRQKAFLRVVPFLRINPMDADVVDIGSGTGFYIERWRKMGVRTIVGTDFTKVSIENLQRKYPGERFYQVDIGSNRVTPLGQSSYDIVSAFDVLFHIVDDDRYRKAVKNIYALLRPGGWFIFSENFLHCRSERTRHQVSRSLEEITNILMETGFKLVRRTPMFVLMNDPIDQPHRFIRWIWALFTTFVQKVNFFGIIFGTLMYPWEIFLTRYLKESPSTEIMICRKREGIST